MLAPLRGELARSRSPSDAERGSVAGGVRLNLRKSLFLLPNVITLASIFCGFDAIRIVSEARDDDDFWRASLLLMFAMFFDTLDGRVARATKTASAFGLQIDSLADVISFGVAPALMIYAWSLRSLGLVGLLASFAFAACGAIRLARFNVLSMRDEARAKRDDQPAAPQKPGKYILGLPIPGGASVLVSLVVANHTVHGEMGAPRFSWLVLLLVLVVSGFMVSTIKFRSFKDLKLNVRTVAFAAAVVASSAVVSASLSPAFVLLWLIGGYLLIGVGEALIGLPRAIARRRERVPATIGRSRRR